MPRSVLHCFISSLLAALLTACGSGAGGASSAESPASTPPTTTSTSPATASADISLLFMGNSHTSVNNLSGIVTAMVKAGMPNKMVAGIEAPGWMHLQERSTDAATLALLKSQRWSFVILQAQDYSQSGLYFYPTTGAEELVRRSRTANATPVMFPEWARRGINESQRIYDLHVSIAAKEPACVAPIPQAFDLALARNPALPLLDADGNHSAPAGAFLAAAVLYATITDRSPNDLPTLPGIAVDDATQRLLRGIAAETVQAVSPRKWCPGDVRPG